MATLINLDGTTKEFVPQNKKKGFTLEELYNILDCELVEPVYLNNGEIILVDEEGFYNGKSLNIDASNYAYEHSGYDYTLLGKALIVDNEEFK